MRVWIKNLLYSASRPDLDDMESVNVIVNLKPPTKSSHWYETNKRILKAKVTCESFEIPPGSVSLDTGRALKDKNRQTKEFCRKIVGYLDDNKRVLLICRDGTSTCGFIAMACRAWYEDPRQANVKDLVKQVRDTGDFTSAKAKEQRVQLQEILEFAREIYNCPFIPKRKKE